MVGWMHQSLRLWFYEWDEGEDSDLGRCTRLNVCFGTVNMESASVKLVKS